MAHPHIISGSSNAASPIRPLAGVSLSLGGEAADDSNASSHGQATPERLANEFLFDPDQLVLDMDYAEPGGLNHPADKWESDADAPRCSDQRA